MARATGQSDWDRFWTVDRTHKKLGWSKRRIMSIIQRYVRPGMSVLDAGCGSGFFSAYFILKECRTYTLDRSAVALNVAKERTGGKAAAYLQVDLLQIEWVEEHRGRFDIIFSDGLFEHFAPAEQDRVFGNLLRCLSSDGKIITFVPNKWSPWQIIRPIFMRGIKEKPFTPRRLKALYERNGATSIECGGINVLPLRWSPEKWFGSILGMLLYSIGGDASTKE